MSEFAPIDGLAGGWHLASGDGAAYLIHDNGASLVIRQTAPPRMPSIDTPGDHGDHYALDFQPADAEILVPVLERGSREGMHIEAKRFAEQAPDGEPDKSLFPAWVTEDQL